MKANRILQRESEIKNLKRALKRIKQQSAFLIAPPTIVNNYF